MKKTAICYACSYCDTFFGPKDVVEAHEAKHFGLSLQDFRTWKALERECKWELYKHQRVNSEETEKQLDDAYQTRNKFKLMHHIENRELVEDQL